MTARTFPLAWRVQDLRRGARYVLIAALLSVVIVTGCSRATRPESPSEEVQRSSCDASLWAHVYHGRFPTAEDRLQVISSCLTVSGVIVNARPEKDGDWHIQLDLDPAYRALLNQANLDKQHGHLVLEPICSRSVSQRDPIAEGVCDEFSQAIFGRDLIGNRVTATGPTLLTENTAGWSYIP